MRNNINAHKPGYKYSPIGWIPNDWQYISLGELSIKVGSGVTPTGGEKVYKSKGRPFIRSQNVGWGQLLLDDVAYIDEATHNTFASTELMLNDVLLNITGASIGRSVIVDERIVKGNVNQHVCVIRANVETLAPKYLNAFLLSPGGQNLINSYQAGGNRQGLNFEQIRSFPIALPSLWEQEALADIFSTSDKAIQCMQQLIGQLKLRNRALSQQLLSGKKRLKGFSEQWQHLQVRKVANEISTKNREDKLLTVLSCTKYHGLVDSLEYFGRKIYSEDTSTYKVVPEGHFAYATNHIEEGSIGYQNLYKEALISPMYTVFKTTDQVNDNYLYKVLKSQHYIHEYQKRMEGSIDRRGGLRWDEFSKIPLYLPPYEEQTAIAELLDKANSELKLYEQQLANLQKQKKGLMQKLLSGEVRVKK